MKNKIDKNIERDRIVRSKLSELGWNVIVVWECELKKKNFDNRMEKLCSEIRNNSTFSKTGRWSKIP